jgi:hypothetical protein
VKLAGGKNTKYGGNKLIFPTPTQTHDSSNHRNGYDHWKTAVVRSSTDCHKTASLTASKLGFDFRIDENYDF